MTDCSSFKQLSKYSVVAFHTRTVPKNAALVSTRSVDCRQHFTDLVVNPVNPVTHLWSIITCSPHSPAHPSPTGRSLSSSFMRPSWPSSSSLACRNRCTHKVAASPQFHASNTNKPFAEDGRADYGSDVLIELPSNRINGAEGTADRVRRRARRCERRRDQNFLLF